MSKGKRVKVEDALSGVERLHEYARAVIVGEMVTGPLVRLACDRHVRDLDAAARKGFRFDDEAANHAIGFIETWVRLPDWNDDEGQPKRFVLQPWQCFIVGSLFGWRWRVGGHRRYRNAYIEAGKGCGKALSIETPIPTVDGWKRMGDINVGDVVFDEGGRPVHVIGVSDVMHDHDCAEVVFDDGSVIVADDEHLWWTEQRCFGSAGTATRGVPKTRWGAWRRGIRTTDAIRRTLRYANGRYQSANHSIPLCGPLGTPARDLPISPYVLGVWLGDGDSDMARVTVADDDIELLAHVAAAGERIGARTISGSRTPRYRIGGTTSKGPNPSSLNARLRSMGLLHSKHIPAIYLRASIDQRLALLQGLMDTDGYINPRTGTCEFTTVTRALIDGMRELLISLGIKCAVHEHPATLYGREVSRCWRMQFHPPPDLPVFRLARKLQHQRVRHARRRLSADRRIVDVRRVPSVPVRCIAVDSPSHLYLAGESMVPTHNTPLLAAIGLYGLMMDGCKAPEIYAAAADRDQAMIMFRDAVRMAQASPDLHGRLKYTGIQHVTNMTYGLGFFRPFSREQGAKSGTRPHMGLIDEVHEHPTAEIINKMRAGAKADLDALFIEITNSGSDRTSICFQHHEHSQRILEGTVEDERWFAYVCALDEGDDPLNDEACWPKANPSLGVTIQPEYLRDQVSAAKHIAAETNTVLRLNFCIWTQQHTKAIDMGQWHQCEPPPEDSVLVGVPCYGGLDLGLSDDISAWVRIWTLGDGRVVVKCRYWLPRSVLEKYPNRPYAQWERASLIEFTEGNTTDYDRIEAVVQEDCRASGVREVAYDKRFAEQMAQHLMGAGITMVDQPQGFQLNEGIRRKLELIATAKLCHGGDAVLGWMASNYVLRHGVRGEVRPDKEKAADKIDGQTALDMALAVWVRQPAETEPQYQHFVVGGRR